MPGGNVQTLSPNKQIVDQNVAEWAMTPDTTSTNAAVRTIRTPADGRTPVCNLFEVVLTQDASAAIYLEMGILNSAGTAVETVLYRAQFGAAQTDGENKGFGGIRYAGARGRKLGYKITNSGGTGIVVNAAGYDS